MWLNRIGKVPTTESKLIFKSPEDSKGSVIHTLHVQNISTSNNSEVRVIIKEKNEQEKDFLFYELVPGEFVTFPKSINMEPGDELKVIDNLGNELSTIFLSIYHCVSQDDADNIYHVPVINGPNSANYSSDVEYVVSNPQPGSIYYWTFDYTDEPDVSFELISSSSVNSVDNDIIKVTNGNITTLEAVNLTDITVRFSKNS